MNKVTKLFYIDLAPALQDPIGVVGGVMVYNLGCLNQARYPSHEQIESHVSDMNRENWKLISVQIFGMDFSLTFFWEKDVMLSELSGNEI